jgi:hypothetical protein
MGPTFRLDYSSHICQPDCTCSSFRLHWRSPDSAVTLSGYSALQVWNLSVARPPPVANFNLTRGQGRHRDLLYVTP